MVETSTRELTIGRAPDNDIVIAQPWISSHHAKGTFLSANVWLMEDLGSANGTEVDGLRIQRTLVIPESRVVLGKKHLLNLTTTFFQARPPSAPPTESEIKEAFRQLELVYKTYEEARLALMKQDATKQAAIRAGCMLIPIIGGAVGQILASRYANIQEKVFALDNELKMSYVCPKCKIPLGNLPYRALVNMGQCGRCRAEWI